MTSTPETATTPASHDADAVPAKNANVTAVTGLIGKPAAGPAPNAAPDAPVDETSFVAARDKAVQHHIRTLRHAIGALRGLGQHEPLAALLQEELAETISESRSIAARKAQKTRPAARRLAPTRARTASEIN